jgi:hypothetical protein
VGEGVSVREGLSNAKYDFDASEGGVPGERVAGVAGCLGCGKGSATVSGRIAYKGESLTSGNIVLHGADGKVASALITVDGRYAVHKALLGDVKIAVLPSTPPQRAPGRRRIRGRIKPHPGQRTTVPRRSSSLSPFPSATRIRTNPD